MKLGSGTIEELQERMTSAEFTRWVAYYRREPFGWEIENWRAAMMASAICNAVRSTIPIQRGHAKPKSLKPSDFYPITQRQEPDLTPAQREYIRKKHGKRRHSNG